MILQMANYFNVYVDYFLYNSNIKRQLNKSELSDDEIDLISTSSEFPEDSPYVTLANVNILPHPICYWIITRKR